MKTVEQVAADYVAAYRHANGVEPSRGCRYWRGWFSVHGCKYRRADILKMTMTLLSRPAHGKEV